MARCGKVPGAAMKVNTQFLLKVPLFEDLGEKELEFIAEKFRKRSYQRNEIILFEEDTWNYMYIVEEGRVKVSRILPSGREVILAFHDTGEYFGEMAMIDGGTNPAMVTAIVPTTILLLNQQEFRSILEIPAVNQALLKMLCRRCRDAWSQIEILTCQDAGVRIRTALYFLCQRKGIKTPGGVTLNLKLTHKDLAEFTGLSRETATRVIKHLREQEILKIRTRQFVISDLDGLIDVVVA